MAFELNIDNHMAIPQPGTVYTYHSLQIDKFSNPIEADYPLEAVCSDCHRPIRMAEEDGDWEHFRREQ